MRDIETRDDLLQIVTVFYEQLLEDPIIGFFFTDVVQLDLAKHIPKIADFWAFQLLGEKNYRGNVFEVHHRLHLKAAMTEDHFHRWVFVLHSTIDSLYAGPTAEAMKLKAAMIARKMAQALASGAVSYDIGEGVQVIEPEPPKEKLVELKKPETTENAVQLALNPFFPGMKLARLEQWLAFGCMLVLTFQIVVLAQHTFLWRYGEDVGFFYYFSWLVNERGYLPYRDLHETSFPGSFILYSLLTHIGGYSVLSYNIIHMVLFSTLCASSFRLLGRINTRFALAGTLMFGAYYFFMHRSMHMQRDFLVLLLVIWSLDAMTGRRPLHWRATFCGLLLGMASAVKPHAALAAPFIVVMGTLATVPAQSQRWRACITASSLSLLAFAGLWCAILAWLWASGVWPAFWRMVTEYMPLYQKMNGIHIALSPTQRYHNAIDWLSGTLLFGSIPILSGLLFCFKNPLLHQQQKLLLGLMPILWLVFSVYVALGGKYWDYHQIPSLYFGQSLLMLWCIPYIAPNWKWLAARLLLLLLISPFMYAGLAPRYALEVACLTGNPVCDSEEFAAYAEEDRLEKFLRETLKPGERVEPLATSTLGPLFPALLRAGVEPVTPYVEGFPLYHDADSTYVRDIRADAMRRLVANPPRFMIRPVNFFAPGGPTASRFDELDTFVEQHYEKVDSSRYPALQPPLSVTIFERKSD